jgi:hypothetical protein
MPVLRTAGRLLSVLLLTIAKVVGAMPGPGGTGGAKTFDHDNATSIHKRPDDYRP